MFICLNLFKIMKKILFLISLSIICFPLFPLSGLAAVYEVTVTINQVRVPERAAMMLKDPSSTKFKMNGASRITIVQHSPNDTPLDSDGTVKANRTIAFYDGQSAGVSFSYDSSVATNPKYAVYIESLVSAQGTLIKCRADCSPVAANSGWYYEDFNYDYTGVPNWDHADCPNPPCTGDTRSIAVDPIHVVSDSVTPSTKYWRSPAIATIN